MLTYPQVVKTEESLPRWISSGDAQRDESPTTSSMKVPGSVHASSLLLFQQLIVSQQDEILPFNNTFVHSGQLFLWVLKGGFKSEDKGNFYVSNINIPNHLYPEQKI